MDNRLRLGAAAGLVLVAAYAAVSGAGIGQGLGSVRRPGVLIFGWSVLRWLLWGSPHAAVLFWLAAATFAVGAVSAVYTRGFGRVRPSALAAVFLLVPAGVLAGVPLLFALMVVVANLATWTALGALIVVIGAAVVAILIAALFSAI